MSKIYEAEVLGCYEGDWSLIKIRMNGERFWPGSVKNEVGTKKLTGIVDNDVIRQPFKYGDTITIVDVAKRAPFAFKGNHAAIASK